MKVISANDPVSENLESPKRNIFTFFFLITEKLIKANKTDAIF